MHTAATRSKVEKVSVDTVSRPTHPGVHVRQVHLVQERGVKDLRAPFPVLKGLLLITYG